MRARHLSRSERCVYNPVYPGKKWNLNDDYVSVVIPIVYNGWLAGLSHIAHKIPTHICVVILPHAAASGHLGIVKLARQLCPDMCARSIALKEATQINHHAMVRYLRKWWRQDILKKGAQCACNNDHIFEIPEDAMLCGAVASGNRALVEQAIVARAKRPLPSDVRLQRYFAESVARGDAATSRGTSILLRIMDFYTPTQEFLNHLLSAGARQGRLNLMRLAKGLGADITYEELLASLDWRPERMPAINLLHAFCQQNARGLNPDLLLHRAVDNDNHEAVYYALDHGATRLTGNVLAFAAAFGDIDLMRRCKEFENPRLDDLAYAGARAILRGENEALEKLFSWGELKTGDIINSIFEYDLLMLPDIMRKVIALAVQRGEEDDIFDTCCEGMLSWAAAYGDMKLLQLTHERSRARLTRESYELAIHEAETWERWVASKFLRSVIP